MSQLIACPECSKHLQVPENLLGKKVQCPECKHTFIATAPDSEDPADKTKVSTKSSPPPLKTPAWDKKAEDDDRDADKKKRRDDDEDDDDDDEDRPRRRSGRRSSRGGFAPHRGGMILALGIIGIVAFQPLGIAAWIMGNTDLKEIRAGRMDPDGEGLTNAGRICGMIATILMIVSLVFFCGGIGLFVVFGAFAAANANKGFPPPGPQRKGF